VNESQLQVPPQPLLIIPHLPAQVTESQLTGLEQTQVADGGAPLQLAQTGQVPQEWTFPQLSKTFPHAAWPQSKVQFPVSGSESE